VQTATRGRRTKPPLEEQYKNILHAAVQTVTRSRRNKSQLEER